MTVIRKSSTGFNPRRLAHCNIFVSSNDRAVPFYRDVCGFTPVFEEPAIMAVFYSNGSSHHDLATMEIASTPRVGKDGHVQIPKGRGQVPGLNHFGFEMESEKTLVDAIHRLREQGVEINRTTDHGISHSVYLFDPDGNLLEFYVDAIDDWRSFFSDHENELISGFWDPDAKEPMTRPLYDANFKPEPYAGAVARPRQIARATLLTPDLPRMREFYETIAGLVLVSVGDDFVVYAGSLGTPAIALFEVASGDDIGLHHIGFELMDGEEPEEIEKKLAEAGLEPLTTIVSSSKRSVVVTDPDGLRLEFYRPTGSLEGAPLVADQHFYLI